MTAQQRLARMRASFDKKRAILAEDYEHFATPRASTLPSKAPRKLAARSSRRGPKQN
jgi:hypothetical protein